MRRDREKAAAAMRAMFEMKKIVIADIERAVKGTEEWQDPGRGHLKLYIQSD